MLKRRPVTELIAFMICILLLCSCGTGLSGDKADDAGNKGPGTKPAVFESTADAVQDETYAPFTITVTDKDMIYVEIMKETYDPSTAKSSFQASFNDKSGNLALTLVVLTGGVHDAQAQLRYGEPGDTRTTAVSDYGYEDLGDRVKFKIVLNDPDVTIAGGDNLTIPLSLFESLETCLYESEPDQYDTVSASTFIRFDVDFGLLEAKGTGTQKLNALLYRDVNDKKYLTPSCEDYRVDIFETNAIIFDSCRIDRAPASGLYVFGTDPQGSYSLKPCKVYRVYEFNHLGSLVSYKEKTVFESESDALHISATNGVNGTHALWFIDWTGVNEVPADFTDEQGLKAICDEFLPAYYADLGSDSGYKSEIVRYENTYYMTFVLDNAGYRSKEFLAGIGETELLGSYLNAEGLEFSADNADDEGFINMKSGDETATVYYSKPEAHRHNISTAASSGGAFPDDFVKMPYDGEYFTPAGDDYILYYSVLEDYGDYRFNHEAALISFDEAGNIIDAKYRYFRPGNMANPMSELVGYKLDFEGTKLIYSDDTYAYFDITGSSALKEYLGDGKYGRLYTRQELIDMSVDEEDIWMPMYGWSTDTGLYISR